MPHLESLHACNPSFTLCSDNKANYYVDLAALRGEDVVKRLRRAIALSPNKPTCQLLSGHIGSGKTTELLRLKFELEQQGFAVIYCAADSYLQINDISLIELWLTLIKLILQQLESKGDSLSFAYLPNTVAEIEKWMRISIPIGISTYGPRLQRILQILRENDQNRRQLRYYLEPRIKSSLLAAGEEITNLEIDRLKQMGKKGLVILVDNLDRLSLAQVEIIFGEGGKYLRQFQCHTIYTVPLLAIANNDDQFQQRQQQHLKGYTPIVLPNLMLRDRQGAINSSNLNLLRQVILARILPNLAAERRLERVTHFFDHLETLDLLCVSSHGHLPYLLSLLSGCLQLQALPISLQTLTEILEIDHATRLSTISDQDHQTLQQYVTKAHSLTPDAINLCRHLLLFEHHDAQGEWFSSPFVKLK
jgi:hypothetical protein